ncbi:MAG: ATP-dependent helicase HrpB [Emcibacteraceae bacterium]|nr:ATP-dependent helicase HrpB [Emcibacteraceae bacterium]
MIIKLPIYEIIPKVKTALLEKDNLVLQAPPGAGKTTIVPLELLEEKWLDNKKIIMLEPRRLAARAAAKRMAEIIGEKIGETVGYRVRMDSKIGPKTRIEVVTEGVLIRKIQSDPELKDIGLIIFDEFHERSVEADLGLALSLDIQEGLRDDLKILVMSATLDGERVAALMNDAPCISSKGRSFDVEHRYIDKNISGHIEEDVVQVITRAIEKEKGSILVFLPGAGEIERVKRKLEDKSFGQNVIICPLYGMLSFKEQDLAIAPAPKGYRKIVLCTDIAETSLTIEGIRIVVDSGLKRSSFYDVRSGMSGLETSTVSKASADQRAGRAGRLEEGLCFRLWTEAANRALKAYNEPEIKKVDLVPLALDLALWGINDAAKLKWLDVPEAVGITKANELLRSLGALESEGRITEHGKLMARFPMHPRFAHMILKANERGNGLLALTIAALMQERDILHLKNELRTADMRLRIEALEHVRKGEMSAAKRLGCNIARAKTILRQAKNWQKIHKIDGSPFNINNTGQTLAVAFPDRVAGQRSEKSSIYILSGGRGARLIEGDPLACEKFISIAHLDKGDRDARIYMAAPIEKVDLEENFKELISQEQFIEWDNRTENIKAQNKTMLGKLPLGVSRIANPDQEKMRSAMIAGIEKMGLDVLPWDKKIINFCQRASLISANLELGFPDFSREHLLKTLEGWLGGYLENIYSRAGLKNLELYEILKNILNWEQQQLLEKLVPSHFKVPSGSNILIDYGVNPPVLSVKLQEMFGAKETPAILQGKIKLTIHLLSPARRPLQITTDLGGFWQNSYPEIKKEMKGRYPKHPWPDNPLDAMPTRKLKPKNK